MLSKLCFSLLLFVSISLAQTEVKKASGQYRFFVDLTAVKQDRLPIVLTCPKIASDEIVYNFPKMVPGTYSKDDFGRFVSQFEAYGRNGHKLKVERLTVNSFKIFGAKKLVTIKYWVDDTWDSPQIEGHHIFEPTGSSIEKDTCFVLNTHALFGYFENMKKMNYSISFKKPKGFYGATAMTRTASHNSNDEFQMPNYNDLVDSPVLYSRPDTTSIDLGETKVLVALYSPKKLANSKDITENIKGTLVAQKAYLGGALPVNNYTFLVVLDDLGPDGHFGALEHSYSSLFYLQEASPDKLAQTIKNTATHEFFHIVTPLTIHSEEIGDFNFDEPSMSRHLWLYEGMTEYAAGHMQIKYGLIDMPVYLNLLQDKIIAMKTRYSETLPITELSLNALGKYKTEYPNVYSKGALIGLCLDIELRKLSQGQYGTQNLIMDLSKTYGKDKSFKDDELFGKIVALTYPDIGRFISTYIEGSQPLPISEYLDKIGIVLTESNGCGGQDQKPEITLSLSKEPNEEQLKLRKYWLDTTQRM